MKRRHFLTAASSLVVPPLWAARHDGTAKTVSIIHTTDLHGHILPTQTYEGLTNVGGLARCATVIRKWRQENPNHLLLDVGDLYQGTDVGLRTKGDVMVKLLNKLNYDAWVLGNHDFDWGRDVVQTAIARAQMPVLGGNMIFSGKAAGKQEKGSPLARLAPHILREVAGFKIGIVGTVTPGLSSWLSPQLLREIEAQEPLESVRASVAELKAAGAHAILLCGHMGFKAPGFCKDDFANRVFELTKDSEDIDVFLGGHTHKDVPSGFINGVPYSQANYHGIHLGRVDLTFHVETGKLLERRVFTVLMDDRFEVDPGIVALVKDDLDLSDRELKRPVGTVTEALSAKTKPGLPSDQELLIGRAIREALEAKKETVDGVLHGTFSEDDIAPGPKTVADMWELMPYENYVVTADFTREELMAVLNEAYANERSSRNLLGFVVRTDGAKKDPVVADILDRAGRPLPAEKKFRIALNSYDAQSGGQRMPRLQEIVAGAAAHARFHEVQTRDAVIEFFLRHKEVSPRTVA